MQAHPHRPPDRSRAGGFEPPCGHAAEFRMKCGCTPHAGFRVGEKVSFQPDGHPRAVLPPSSNTTARQSPLITEGGQRWNVAPTFLRKLTDVGAAKAQSSAAVPPSLRLEARCCIRLGPSSGCLSAPKTTLPIAARSVHRGRVCGPGCVSGKCRVGLDVVRSGTEGWLVLIGAAMVLPHQLAIQQPMHHLVAAGACKETVR